MSETIIIRDRSKKKSEQPASLIAKRKELLDRLNKGDAMITAAEKRGEDTKKWVDGWIALLHEYEDVCRRIAGEY